MRFPRSDQGSAKGINDNNKGLSEQLVRWSVLILRDSLPDSPLPEWAKQNRRTGVAPEPRVCVNMEFCSASD